MYYLKHRNEKEFYSHAYNGSRSLWIQDNFIWILAVLLLLAGLLVYSEIRYNKKKG